nr:MAG TPA: AGA PTS system mannose/fructose/sorbose family IID component [Bacteriophage sp.]
METKRGVRKRHIGFFRTNPSVTACHLPLYFALQNTP